MNVATHHLVDVLSGAADAAVVISNDSDSKLPIALADEQVSIGLINPTKNYSAGALNGFPTMAQATFGGTSNGSKRRRGILGVQQAPQPGKPVVCGVPTAARLQSPMGYHTR